MQRAIVTGGTRGIGFAIAHALLAQGARVMITGRDTGRVDEAVRSLVASGHDAARIAGAAVDVRDRAAVDRLVASTVRQFDGLDVLINNAAVGASGNVEVTTDETWHAVIETNVTGPFYFSRAAIPVIRRAGGGWIINVASLAARHPFPRGATYCASKAALVAFTESLMQEVRFDNIRVSVILPGSVATEFSGPKAPDDDIWKLSPDDVAEAVIDLLRHPARSLPSLIELRPSKPKKN
ncbi:MAG: SDR family oxidoreductase [Vicinamibacterales bacterium]